MIHLGISQEAIGRRETTADDLKCFTGPLTIRITEADGTYDHAIAIEDVAHEFVFPCHSRMRRIRRKKKEGEPEEPSTAPAVETPMTGSDQPQQSQQSQEQQQQPTEQATNAANDKPETKKYDK